MFYYSKSTFQKAGLSEQNSEYATVGAGVVNFLMALISIYVVSRFNRRPTFLLSASCAVVCLLILGIAITYIVSTHKTNDETYTRHHKNYFLECHFLDAIHLYFWCVKLCMYLRYWTGSHTLLYWLWIVWSGPEAHSDGSRKYGELGGKFYNRHDIPPSTRKNWTCLILHICIHHINVVYICQVGTVQFCMFPPLDILCKLFRNIITKIIHCL